MENKNKTKQQLLDENKVLRAQIEVFKKTSAKRKETEEYLRISELRFRTIYEYAPVMINSFDKDGFCQLWNNECTKALGWTMEEMKACDKPLDLCYPDPEGRRKVMESITTTTKKVFREWHPTAKDGSGHVHMWANFDLPDGAVISIGYDITEIKKTEEKLRKARERAEQDNEIKTEFLMNVSHDIRTPMNVINGFNELLMKTSLNEEQEKFCSIIKRKGSGLIRLIEDVIDIAAVEKGVIRISQSAFFVQELIEDLKETVIAQIGDRNISFKCNVASNVPCQLLGDLMRLRQILENLCGNAVKYTDEGAIKLTISADSEAIEGNLRMIRFSVEDTGIGIPEDKIQHIFEPYSRFHELRGDKEKDGVGMGLHIVHTLIKEMDGVITVESEVGKGSKFLFELGMEEAEIASEDVENDLSEKFDTKVNLSGMNILIAEDDEDSRELMNLALGKVNCNVQFAHDGDEVLRELKNRKYDLVLMDIRMPKMDGFKTTEIIRREIDKVVPIIAITAHVMDGVEGKCKDVGMSGYIAKPVDISRLKKIIQQYVSKK